MIAMVVWFVLLYNSAGAKSLLVDVIKILHLLGYCIVLLVSNPANWPQTPEQLNLAHGGTYRGACRTAS